jgi:hypothetical protein
VARALRRLRRVPHRPHRRHLNGPCGGSHDGLCEVTGPEKEEIECAWALIWERLKAQGREELMFMERPPKDWSKSSSGGPRKMVREEAKPV